MALAQRTGARHCVSCASGTDALLIALMALGIGPDDEVITSPFTFIATVEMIALLGAKPIPVDIDPRTWNSIHPSSPPPSPPAPAPFSGFSLRPMRRHRRNSGRRRQSARHRRRRAELRSNLQGPPVLQPHHHRLHQLFPLQAAGRLRRCRGLLHQGRHPRRRHARNPEPWPGLALSARPTRRQRTPRHHPGRRPAGQAGSLREGTAAAAQKSPRDTTSACAASSGPRTFPTKTRAPTRNTPSKSTTAIASPPRSSEQGIPTAVHYPCPPSSARVPKPRIRRR